MTTLTSFINDMFSTPNPASASDRQYRIDRAHALEISAARELNDSIHLWSAREASQVEIHRYASSEKLAAILHRFDKANGQGIADVVLLLDESLPVQLEEGRDYSVSESKVMPILAISSSTWGPYFAASASPVSGG